MKKETSDSSYHISVLLHESMEGLNVQPDGIYVDATYGGGGHSKEILNRLNEKGKLIAFDQDEEAQQNALQDTRFTLVQSNFRELKRFLRLHEALPVNGIIADLGVSSRQFDAAERGFSFRFDGPLDMRMNRQAEITAAYIVNNYSPEQLQQILSVFGEVRNAKTLANAITDTRAQKKFKTIADFKEIVDKHRVGEPHKYFAQVFQAIRIEVNDEMGALKNLLVQSAEVLKPGGRLAVVTFHSLEDRLVKNYIKNGCFEDEPAKDFYGNIKREFKLINKKPIEASEKEKKENSRSRSAKLRIAEKL